MQTIDKTDFQFPGQTAVYHGSVRDVYTIEDTYLVAVASDRISAFDFMQPRSIPYKGQVLNQIAGYFLEATKDVVDNWLISISDPNVAFGYKCQPIKVEVVVRGVLVGHAWREYSSGKRELCGVPMPDGLKEFDTFPEPLITPATKAEVGHDEDISGGEIVKRGLASQDDWDQIVDCALQLFSRGQEMAAARGLVLADTKYEFGNKDGMLCIIDEIHTPDSSRYFYARGYNDFVMGKSDQRPEHLSKEFVREWLIANGFQGLEGQTIPEMDDEFVESVSKRYIELYEALTGNKFEKPKAATDVLKRIETNVLKELQESKS